MEIAKIQVSKVSAEVVWQNAVPAGIVGATISVEYTDSCWQDFSKTVVFTGCETKDVLCNGNVIPIPPEVVARPQHELFVGFYGIGQDRNLAVPTLRVSLGNIFPAANPSGDTSTDSTLPVWAQLQQVLDGLKESGGIFVDETLSIQGQAADAKATGDAIAEVENSATAAMLAAANAQTTADSKVPSTGWTANMYLGTDTNGNVIAKSAPISSGGSNPTYGSSTMEALTFTGAVNATYDGSEAVTVEIPSGGGSGGSGASGWETVQDVTLTESVMALSAVDISAFTEIELYMQIPATPDGAVNIYVSNGSYKGLVTSNASYGVHLRAAWYRMHDNYWVGLSISNQWEDKLGQITSQQHMDGVSMEIMSNNSYPIPAGARIVMKGLR